MEATAASSIGAGRVGGRVEPPLELAEHEAEQRVAPGRLRERARVAPQRRQVAGGGVEAVEQQRRRPRREVLGEPEQHAARRPRAGQARGEVRVDRAERRAVDDVQREPDREPGRLARDELAEQLDVVVLDAEDLLVERLLGGPHRGAGRAREGAAEGAGSVEGHPRQL